MKVFIALCLFVAVASAGTIQPEKPLEGRITNGVLAKPGQAPYQVGLMLDLPEYRAWCGGTLISDRWILTAAHCADEALGVTVYLGATDVTNNKEKGQQRLYTSKSNIIVHEGWDSSTTTNDISLIKLPNPIEFNDHIQPATLPKEENGKYSTYVGDIVMASGWGKESDSDTGSTQFLRYIEVPVMKQSTCNTYYLGSITDKMICTSTSGKKSTCNGDSGGPLIYKDGDINYVIGATSFGIALGCERNWPAVFTRVSSYVDWITAKTGISNK